MTPSISTPGCCYFHRRRSTCGVRAGGGGPRRGGGAVDDADAAAAAARGGRAPAPPAQGRQGQHQLGLVHHGAGLPRGLLLADHPLLRRSCRCRGCVRQGGADAPYSTLASLLRRHRYCACIRSLFCSHHTLALSSPNLSRLQQQEREITSH